MHRRDLLRATAIATAGALVAGCVGATERDDGPGNGSVAGDGSDGNGDGGGAVSDGGGGERDRTTTRAPTMTPPEAGTPYPGSNARSETVSTVPEVTPTTTTAAITMEQEPDAVVTIEGSTFEPRRLEIAPGQGVRWINRDSVDHAVETVQFHAAAESRRQGILVPAEGFNQIYQFGEARIYEYECSFHGASTGCGVVLVGDVSLDERLPCE
jgi:plastocyanin